MTSELPMRRYAPEDRICVGAGTLAVLYYRCVRTDENGHMFERVDQPGLFEPFSHQRTAELERDPGFRIDRGWFDAGRARARLTSGVAGFVELPDDEKPVVLWRVEWVRRYNEKRSRGEASLSDASMKAAIPTIQAEMIAEAQKRVDGARAGAVICTPRKPPCPRTLRTWITTLAAAKGEPTALRDNYRHCGHNGRSKHAELEQLMVEHARRYLGETRLPMVRVYEDLRDAVKTANDERARGATLGALPIPCDKTFYARIKRLRAVDVAYGRLGQDTAGKKFRPVTGGLDVTRIGEVVEIDEWRVPLQTLLIDVGVWEKMDEEQRAGVERVRLWLSAAIDVASRCIIGLRLSNTANSRTAIETMSMRFRDKTRMAALVDARAPWNQACGVERFATDQGSAHVGWEFKAAAESVDAIPFNPPAGMAEMRAHIERLFGTMHTGMISRFSGRTFHNVVALGDYPSQARASITVEEEARAFVRYVVDVYHNDPHDELKGETPRNAWRRLEGLYKTITPPNRDQLCNACGEPATCALDKRGVRIENVWYQSPALQEYRRCVGEREVAALYDPFDLGRVSVWIEGRGHLTVPAAHPGFDGLTMAEWKAVQADLRRRFGEEAAVEEETVRAAIADIRMMSDRAMARSGILAIPTVQELASFDKRLNIAWRRPDDADAAHPDILETIVPSGKGPGDRATTHSPFSAVTSATAGRPHGAWKLED